MSKASLSTPEKAAPFPAAIPATCVPWMQSDNGHGIPDPIAVLAEVPSGHTLVDRAPDIEYKASEITFPRRNGCVLSIPVSSTATVHPAPVNPAAQARVAP